MGTLVTSVRLPYRYIRNRKTKHCVDGILMKLLASTEDTVTLHLSNDELETIISAHVWAQGGLEELLKRDLEEDNTRQVNEAIDEIYSHLHFLRKLGYVRRGNETKSND